MLRTLKSQRFYATCKITSLPGTVSWIVVKDMGLMGQGQRFITQGPANTVCITIFASVYLALPSPTGAMLMGPDGCLHPESTALQERKFTPDLIKTSNMSTFFSGEKHIFCPQRLFTI